MAVWTDTEIGVPEGIVRVGAGELVWCVLVVWRVCAEGWFGAGSYPVCGFKFPGGFSCGLDASKLSVEVSLAVCFLAHPTAASTNASTRILRLGVHLRRAMTVLLIALEHIPRAALRAGESIGEDAGDVPLGDLGSAIAAKGIASSAGRTSRAAACKDFPPVDRARAPGSRALYDPTREEGVWPKIWQERWDCARAAAIRAPFPREVRPTGCASSRAPIRHFPNTLGCPCSRAG